MPTYRIIIESSTGIPREADTESKEAAIGTCRELGIPHFYELDPSNPFIPKMIWKIKPAENPDGYIVEGVTWAQEAAIHDKH